MTCKAIRRTEEVRFHDLREVLSKIFPEAFPEGEDPVFLVRNLEGPEFYEVQQAPQKRRDFNAIFEKLADGEGSAIAQAIEEHMGPGSMPDAYIRHVETVVLGLVSPEWDRTQVVEFFRGFPVQGYQLATKIWTLTGQGATIPGESDGSGGTPASAMTST